jgi:hypothetical protein
MARQFTLRFILPLLVLSAVVFFTFARCRQNQFVNWDDPSEISENIHFNPVTWPSLWWNWSNTQLTLYMPITYMVWGGVAAAAARDSRGFLQPAAFHELNVLLHLLCAFLVFRLILQLTDRVLPALVGALLFAVHPLQVEAVAWASGMYTLLSTAFSLAALIAYVSAVPASGSRLKLSRFSLATFFYILALLTKAASVSIVPAAGVIDVLVLRRPPRKSIRSLSLWIVLGLPIIFVAKSFQDVSVIATPPIWFRPMVALDALGFYLRKIIVPIRLIPDYGRNPTWVMQHPAAMLISAATAMMAILLAWAARRRAVWITTGLGILLAGTGPYLGLTTFDFQYVSTVADRYAYFGMVGVALLAAGAAGRSRAALAALLIAVAACIPMSRTQVNRWHDTDTLFRYTLDVNANSLVSHGVFGFLAASRGDFQLAERDYQAALKVWPEDAKIHFNLGNLYLKQSATSPSQRVSLLNNAIEHYTLAVKFQPRFVDYRNSLAAALDRIGQFDQAFEQWKEVIGQDPTDLDARNNLADMLARHGLNDRAKEEYRAVLRIDPKNAHATDGLRRIEAGK